MDVATDAPGPRAGEVPPPTVESDGVRVRAVIAGSSGAYAALYDRYARLIRAVCHDTTGNVADAQDLCQEVFLRAYRNLGCLRDQERFAGWLLGIARTTCREWRRKVSRERRRRQPLELDPAAPEEQRGAEPLTDRLLATIARLPERERLAMHLFYLQEQPAEVAREVMRLSRSGFYRVLDRARRRLRRMIGAKGEPNQ